MTHGPLVTTPMLLLERELEKIGLDAKERLHFDISCQVCPAHPVYAYHYIMLLFPSLGMLRLGRWLDRKVYFCQQKVAFC